MKKILFPTAYSPYSTNTWRYALRLAQYFEAEITLMHVYEDEALPLVNENFTDEEEELIHMSNDERYEEEEINLRLFAEKNTPKQFHSIPLNFVVADGKVGEAIFNEEKETHYDLIVMGTKTTRHFADSLFGSTSLKILAKAKTPVFLVPPTAKFKGINKIACATNFKPSEVDTYHHLLDWVSAFDAQLHVVHVHNPLFGSGEVNEKMQQLKDTFKDEAETGIMSFQLLKGSIAKSIEDYLVFNDIDMVALTSHERGYFSQLFDSSISNEIATKALVPILVFKDKTFGTKKKLLFDT